MKRPLTTAKELAEHTVMAQNFKRDWAKEQREQREQQNEEAEARRQQERWAARKTHEHQKNEAQGREKLFATAGIQQETGDQQQRLDFAAELRRQEQYWWYQHWMQYGAHQRPWGFLHLQDMWMAQQWYMYYGWPPQVHALPAMWQQYGQYCAYMQAWYQQTYAQPQSHDYWMQPPQPAHPTALYGQEEPQLLAARPKTYPSFRPAPPGSPSYKTYRSAPVSPTPVRRRRPHSVALAEPSLQPERDEEARTVAFQLRNSMEGLSLTWLPPQPAVSQPTPRSESRPPHQPESRPPLHPESPSPPPLQPFPPPPADTESLLGLHPFPPPIPAYQRTSKPRKSAEDRLRRLLISLAALEEKHAQQTAKRATEYVLRKPSPSRSKEAEVPLLPTSDMIAKTAES